VRSLLVGAIALTGCHHDEQSSSRASASASASAAASAFASSARHEHLVLELNRARERWQGKPALGDCAVALREKADLELCQAANNALAELEKAPTAPAANALPVLADSALALTRLSQRVRYLSLEELSARRKAGDGGAPPSPSAGPQVPPLPLGKVLAAHEGQRAFELGEGPVARLMGTTIHLERDVVRHLGAYLEYDELPIRRAAFETVKRLRNEHPQWPLIDRLLREAALLEMDAGLKRELQEFSASGLPERSHPGGHSADSK